METSLVERAVVSRGGGNITVKMSDGSEVNRPMTPREVALEAALNEFVMGDCHGVWWAFGEEVLNSGKEGYELMELADAFVATHPDWAYCSSVDDDHHMSSSLVFVRHGTAENYMGTTAVYIPQRGGPPTQFFCYPGNARSVLLGLAHTSPVDVPEVSEGEGSFDADIVRMCSRPSSFDFFQDRWRTRPWYANMGFVFEEPPAV